MHEKQGNNTSPKLAQIGSMVDQSGTSGAVVAGSKMDNEACDHTNLKDLGIVILYITTITTCYIFVVPL